jgi:hypothetical protein
MAYLAADVTAPAPARIAGLTEPSVSPLERVAIRLRESSNTLSAWKLSVTAPEGAGVMVRIETPAGPLFRGEGWFLGWPQETLSTAWAELLPHPETETPHFPQLG